MSDNDVLKRWQTERRVHPEPTDTWSRIAIWLLVFAACYFAGHIVYGFTVEEPPIKPTPYLSQWELARIDECRMMGHEYQLLVEKMQTQAIKRSAHPLLHEAQRARMALRLLSCRRDVEGML